MTELETMPVVTEQTFPATEFPQEIIAPKRSKKFIVIAIAVLLLAAGLVGYYASSLNQYIPPTDSTPTPTSTVSVTETPTTVTPSVSVTVTPTVNVPVRSTKTTGMMAYVQVGNVWLYDPETDSTKQLTKTGEFATVDDWSPDGKYILTSPADAFDNGKYLLINASNGSKVKEITIPTSGVSSPSNIVWLSNTQFVQAVDASLYKVGIDGKVQKIGTIPDSIGGGGIADYLNSKATVAFYDNSGPDLDMKYINVSSYNFATKKEIHITNGGYASALGWLGDKVIFTQKGTLMSASPDGTAKQTLANANVAFFRGMVGSEDSTVIFLVGEKDQKSDSPVALSYDLVDSKLQVESDEYTSGYLSDASISRNDKYASFTWSVDGTVVVNRMTHEKKSLCPGTKASCGAGVWQK